MKGLLCLATILVVIGCCSTNTAVNQDLVAYQGRVRILQDILQKEGCSVNGILGKRQFNRSAIAQIQLEAEIKLYHKLSELVFQCREQKGNFKQHGLSTQKPKPVVTTDKTKKRTKPHMTNKYGTTSNPKPSRVIPKTTPTSRLSWCRSAINLTEAWRMDHNGTDLNKGNKNCDTRVMMHGGRPWFRFSEHAGNRLLDHCVPVNSCGTTIALWSDDPMPVRAGVVKNIHAYGSQGPCLYDDRDACCRKSRMPLTVMRCSDQPNDFIYRHVSMGHCHYGYCGMNA